ARRAAAGLFIAVAGGAQASIVADRRRVILNDGEQAAIVSLSNKSDAYPYLVQSWLADERGTRITTPLMVVTPLQRVE
ncbi:fimbria/pilus periplasmic chaperone, partial [Burkholderia pseudomallei]